jgi:hypothetical protein
MLRRGNVHPFGIEAASPWQRDTAAALTASPPATVRNAAILLSRQETLML